MTELVTSGSVGGMASNGCLYPEHGDTPNNRVSATVWERHLRAIEEKRGTPIPLKT